MPTFASASGYNGIESSPLSRTAYSDIIMSKVYEEDWLMRITNTQFLQDIAQCGQKLQIMMAPEVGELRAYVKNQQLTPDTVSTTAKCVDICNAAYHDIKFDIIDIKQACENWAPYEEKLLEAMYQKYVDTMRNYVLGRMMMQVSPQTSLDHAGRLRDIDLGTPGKPLHVTPKNLIPVLAKLQRALVEQKRWRDGEMFIIVPPALRSYLAMSPYSNSDWSCKCGSIISGMWDHDLMGFTPIESIHVPVRMDETGQLAYYIIAGHKDATAYISNILESRLVQSEQYFGVRYQYVVAWGAEVIYPDALAMGYWTFDPLM